MKNLPERIYLNFGDLTEEEYKELDFKDLSEVTWSEDDVQGMNEEYVRTDAFIKKMQDWIKNRAESFIVDTPVFPYFDYKKVIEDLKKHLEDKK